MWHRFLFPVAPAAAAFALGLSAGADAGGPPAAADAWPQMMRDAQHSSVSPDAQLGAQNASTLGLAWMSPLRAADLGSPVSAYNATLGKTVTYVGDERGDVSAFDESNGTTLWSTSLGFGDALRATPLVAPDGSVWVATSYSARVYKLDGVTGNVLCSVQEKIRMDASPMYAAPGGVPTIYESTNDFQKISGVTVAIRATDCKQLWSFSKWVTYAGSWATAAYGVDASGRALVFVGTADPDTRMYALDAKTGARVWDFAAYNPPPKNYDIGAAATVSPPGNNGIKGGALYFPTKYGIMYALDLGTGKKLWAYDFNADAHTTEGGRSSAALAGRYLVFGMADGVYALDAVTGKKLWHYVDPAAQEVLSSPAVTGPGNAQVVAFGDAAGVVHVLRLADGKDLYDYQTGNYVTSSPAVVNGRVSIASTDGFLYDFTVGGGNAAAPATAIVAPATGSKIANPGGEITVRGTASGTAAVGHVVVSVQQGGPTGTWWNAATNAWESGAVDNVVGVNASPAGRAAWSFQFPVPSSGSTYQVFADAVDVAGQADRAGAQSSFTVLPNASLPQLQTSASLVPPGGTFSVTGSGFGAKEVVDFTLQSKQVASAKTDAKGNVPATNVRISGTADFGNSTLTATGQTSHRTTTAAIDVTNVWADGGYDAERTNYEPDDLTFEKTLQATKHGFVARAWLFPSSAAFNSSPAVYAGTAYAGNDAGTLYAIDAASGGPFWSYTTPSRKAIHGSAAVDGGYVFFGCDDDTLYALDAADGSLAGTTALDGIPTAPAVAGGTIFVGTDNGSVFAIAETTGKVLWQTNVGAPIHSAPAVDIARNVLAVGDDGGTVTQLAASTGAVTFTHKTGGAIVAPVAIHRRTEYVGSSDGNFYAFDETSGKPIFTYAARSPVTAIAVAVPNAYVGTASGTLALLNAGGKAIYKLAVSNAAIVGIGVSSTVPFVETADGKISAFKNTAGRVQYVYATGGALSTAPAIVDGAVFVAAGDTSLLTFTPYGNAPIDAKTRRFLADLRRRARHPARWAAGR